MDPVSLEDVIRQYIQLPPVPSGTGWYPVLHTTCDKGKKGPRGGFRFDGDVVAFHCFNCGTKTVYDPSSTGREGQSLMPAKMQKILQDFNIPEDEWKKVLFSALSLRDKGGKNGSKLEIKLKIEPTVIELPENFYLLKNAKEGDVWAEIARIYLKERKIDPLSYDFMLSKKNDDIRMNKWLGRVIIPIYKDNHLIFYQGRDLTGTKQKKYENPAVSREKIMYGYDKLFEYNDLPLYIVEGWFDAKSIDGVAIFGNEISKSQANWLNRSNKKKVYIPDRFGDGTRGALEALELGWSISTPSIGDCKDINEAVVKYGRLYVMKSIAENTASGFEARTKIGIYCK